MEKNAVRGSGRIKLSKYIKPMLATLGDNAFDDQDWIFELKWDGYRAVAEIDDDDIKLYSRNGLSFNHLYSKVVAGLKKLKTKAVLDGEIVVLNANGKPEFQKLQQYTDQGKYPIVYYVFDCISYQGKSLVGLPLLERKKILKKILKRSEVIRYSDHVEAHGKALFEEARKQDLEGVIAKHATSLYVPGKRSRNWLKIKNHNTQEAIIIGYTQPKGSRKYFGALLLAINEKGKLRYIGHTGTGFTETLLKLVYEKMQPLIRPTPPLERKLSLVAA